MRIVRHGHDRPEGSRGGVFALGAFDGVHRDHLPLLDRARALARRKGVGLTVALPPRAGLALTPLRTQARLLAGRGADVLWLLRGIGPDEAAFADAVLHRELAAAVIVRDDAAATGDGIRARLASGDLVHANALLGRNYEIEGHVRDGRRLGRTIGFPTANIRLGRAVRPAFGVYAVRVASADGMLRDQPGVANIGVRPTVDGATELLEAHLFDWSGNLYGRPLCVGLVTFLRPERRFAGIDELKAQIARDAADARAALARTSP
ncbi:MAG: bifunctional riboflavin kinase/FMN adenylyltransferase [Alphaproteobacteria bacterium]|nr:bifunctional riboflavin kinase/FMN adenylyltransferase [Alphaproteobacteria bacterium]